MDASALNRTSSAVRSGIAERLWDASKCEFSQRGYHGARVQGIARRAGCNVALLYRHWSSKKALYVDVLRSVWEAFGSDALATMERGHGPSVVVAAYLEAHMKDAVGSQIVIRELLDGGPFLSQLLTSEPQLMEPVRRAARELSESDADARTFRPGVDPMLTVLTVGGLAALIASGHEAARPFFDTPIPPETWRQHVNDLLLNGIVSPAPRDGAA